jgi:hypothetical protein
MTEYSLTPGAKMKRRPMPAGASEENCDAWTSQALAEDYRDPDLQNQDRPLSEDGQPVSGRGGLPPEWQQQDSRDSYTEAIRAIGESVRAGAEVPACLLPTRRGEIARGDPLPPGPYSVGMMHGPGGALEWPFVIRCGDGRAIAGHVNSRACAEAIVDALNERTER